MALGALRDGPAGARASGPFTLELIAPPPSSLGDEEHGGLKLDWHSDVGRTGALLGWWPIGRDNDAGVPVVVVDAIAAGLCAVSTVAGCTLDVPDSAGPEWRAVPGGHACRFPGCRRLGFGAPPLGLIATRHPRVVAGFFDADGFPWALERQLFLLAPPGTLPRLDRALVGACFRLPIPATTAQLTRAGVVGLVRAGVDGDVAGLYVLDPGWRASVVRALADAVVAAGGRWEEHDGRAHWSARAGTGASGADRAPHGRAR